MSPSVKSLLYRDYLRIYDDQEADWTKELAKLCGFAVPADIVTAGNSAYIYFRSNRNREYAGFKIKYSLGRCSYCSFTSPISQNLL